MTADRRDLISALGGRFVAAPAAMDDDYLVADDSVEGRWGDDGGCFLTDRMDGV